MTQEHLIQLANTVTLSALTPRLYAAYYGQVETVVDLTARGLCEQPLNRIVEITAAMREALAIAKHRTDEAEVVYPPHSECHPATDPLVLLPALNSARL